MSDVLIGEIQIIVGAAFLAAAIVGERYAMLNSIGPLTFLAGRYIVTFIVVVAAQPFFKLIMRTKLEVSHEELGSAHEKEKKNLSNLLFYGIISGFATFGAAAFQQIALTTVTAGATSYILGMDVLLIPILEWTIPQLGGKFSWYTLLASLISITGLFLFLGCFNATTECGDIFSWGYLFAVLSMMLWATDLIFGATGCKFVDVVSLTIIIYAVVTVFSSIIAPIFEPEYFVYPYTAINNNKWLIIATGIFDAIGYTIVGFGFMYVSASRSSLLLTTTSIFCVVFSYFILYETLSPLQIFGAFVMTSAVFVAYFEAVFAECSDESDKVGTGSDGGSSSLATVSSETQAVDAPSERTPLLDKYSSTSATRILNDNK